MIDDWPVHPDRHTGRRSTPVVIRVNARGSLEPQSLVKFALNARIDLLAYRTISEPAQWEPAVPTYVRTAMARKLGYTDRFEFSRLTGAATAVNVGQVRDLEHRLMEFAYAERGLGSQVVRALGWLTAFAKDLLPDDDDNLQATMLARWLGDLSQSGPTNSAEALVMGEGLLGLLGAAPSPRAVDLIWDRHRVEADRTARGLVAVSTRPPGGGALAAVHSAALVGPRLLPLIGEHLRGSPVGFRAMRIVTRMAQLLAGRTPSWWSIDGRTELTALQDFLVGLARGTPLPDPYPGRSLFLEAVRAVTDLSQARADRWGFETGPQLIHDRLIDRDRPRRERMYAAYCILELGLQDGAAMERLVGDDDPAWGYVCRLIQYAESRRVPVAEVIVNPTFDRGEPFEFLLVHHVTETAAPPAGDPYLARLPESVARATAQLLRCALLSPDGPCRSQACDALREAGVTNEAAGIIANLIIIDKCPDWLCELGTFTIGQLGDPVATGTLEELAGDVRRSVAVRHAAFFALGDLRRHRPTVLRLTTEVLTSRAAETPVEVRRAATYAVAVLRPDAVPGQPTRPYSPEQHSLLEYLANQHATSPDWMIRMLARWGLGTHERAVERDQLMDERSIWGVAETDIARISPDSIPVPNRRRGHRRGETFADSAGTGVP